MNTLQEPPNRHKRPALRLSIVRRPTREDTRSGTALCRPLSFSCASCLEQSPTLVRRALTFALLLTARKN